MRFDCLILGDGAAAWATAGILASAGRSVAIIGRAASSTIPRIGEVLPPEGVMAAEALGLARLLDHPAHLSSPGVLSLWGAPQSVPTRSMDRPGGRAFCLDRDQLERDLQARAMAAGAKLFTWTGGLTRDGEGWSATVAAGRVQSQALLDATGRAAYGARAAGAKVHREDRLVGLAQVLDNAPVSDARLIIESLPDGWAYAAPLTGDRLVGVVLSDADVLPRSRAARNAFARARLAATTLIAPNLPQMHAAKVHGRAAWSQRTEPSAGAGWAAIGDAAMAFDPIGGAGLTKALRDVSEATGILLSRAPSELSALVPLRTQRYNAYGRALAEAYGAERRYLSPFWTRRHGIADTPRRLV